MSHRKKPTLGAFETHVATIFRVSQALLLSQAGLPPASPVTRSGGRGDTLSTWPCFQAQASRHLAGVVAFAALPPPVPPHPQPFSCGYWRELCMMNSLPLPSVRLCWQSPLLPAKRLCTRSCSTSAGCTVLLPKFAGTAPEICIRCSKKNVWTNGLPSTQGTPSRRLQRAGLGSLPAIPRVIYKGPARMECSV